MNARHALPRRDTGEPTGYPQVSVIMTVLNEAAHLPAAVERILGQDYAGDVELVIALGPSRDSTDALAAELSAADHRVRTVANPSGSTPAGLNAALAASKYEVIARVDGHAVIPRDYLRVAVETLDATGADNVGGIMWAEGETPFEQAVARAMTTKLGVGNARFHTGGVPGPADTVYLGVFRRSALERVGGYDEAFRRAQDWEMNYRIRRSGGLVWFQPKMRVSYRPRATIRLLARQYFHYGRWRRVVMRQHPGSGNLRYLAAPLAVIAVAVGTLAGLAGLAAGAAWLAAGFLVPAGYLLGIVAGSVVTGRGLPGRAWTWLPVVYATMHSAWGAGFLTSPPSLGRGAKSAQI
jgi:glycosyltransferase involved in cell wall biosynthesis